MRDGTGRVWVCGVRGQCGCGVRGQRGCAVRVGACVCVCVYVLVSVCVLTQCIRIAVLLASSVDYCTLLGFSGGLSTEGT